jgi:hypothetical protein
MRRLRVAYMLITAMRSRRVVFVADALTPQTSPGRAESGAHGPASNALLDALLNSMVHVACGGGYSSRLAS